MLSTSWTFGATIELYQTTKQELSARFGTEASWGDVAWSLYAKYADKFSWKPDFDALAITYACMAGHLYDRHKPFQWNSRESCRYRLMLLRQYGFKQAWVTAYPYNCLACEALRNKTYSITDTLINNPPLPPDGCVCVLDKKLSAGYCVCQLAGDPKDMTLRF
jgi:hypothetical protein